MSELVERLRALKRWGSTQPVETIFTEAADHIERLEAQIVSLREALEPFALEAESYDYGDGSGPDLKDAPDESSLNEINDLLVGHLRYARSTLSSTGEG